MVNGKVGIWTVVILIVSILISTSGILFGVIKESAAKNLIEMKINVKSNTARLDILEREYAVTNNELRHINRKLDQITESIKEHMEK